jgi:hypothetical protein
MKYASETLEKTLEDHCNHTQYPDKTNATYM